MLGRMTIEFYLVWRNRTEISFVAEIQIKMLKSVHSIFGGLDTPNVEQIN